MRKVFFVLWIGIFVLLGQGRGWCFYLSNYCTTPPFLTQAVAPNVLILLDNSGSMNEFAYKDTYNSTTRYYGYFDASSNYTYNTSLHAFEKSSTGKWNGNFLNWLTMRRMDIAKKVLIGGKLLTGSSHYILVGGLSDRDFFKAGTFYPYPTPYPTSSLYFYFYLYSGYEYFSVYMTGGGYLGTFRVAVKVDSKPKGIIQNMWDRVRFGLEIFNVGTKFERGYYYDGGRIISSITGPGENTSLVNTISTLRPQTWTPLAESLYEAIRYFRGDYPAYTRGARYVSPIEYRCQKNFVIIITDGESTMDRNLPHTAFRGRVSPVSDPNFDIKTYMDAIASNEGYSSQWGVNANGAYGTYYLEGVAYYAHTQDIDTSLAGTQTLSIYTIFCFDESPVGKTLLEMTAKYGGFKDKNGNGVPDLQSEWDKNGDSVPDNFLYAQSGFELENYIKNVLSDILKETASGTSASLLTKKSRVGRNLIQAVFYPKKQFSLNELTWVGYLYTYWFFYAGDTTNIREDTIENKALDVCQGPSGGGDYIMEFLVNNATSELNIKAYKSSCNGSSSSLATTYSSLDRVHPVWEAGEYLYNHYNGTNATNRSIYTYVGNLQPSSEEDMVQLKDLGVSNSSLFGDEDGNGIIDDETGANDTLMSKPISFSDLIEYIYGMDKTGFRVRSGDGNRTWKLGDIIYSTPKIVDYGNYSVVFVGANDGMLHAFKLGGLRYDGLSAYQQTRLCNDKYSNSCTTDELGKELWAYIPKNMLPYLRALADPEYCHYYYVDLMPYVIELDTDKDGEIDKRILIGGMRFGGAVGCSSTGCINPPLDTCPTPSDYNASSNACIGLSSYFALDITNATYPKFLWEFARPDLGFTFSGPAFIERNGNYYILFASGPTNYKGEVAQPLKFFVLSLNSIPGSADFFTIDHVSVIDKRVDPALSSFINSFGGRLFTKGIDYDGDGNTDMVFIGVNQQQGMNRWQGNLIGIYIDSTDPTMWDYQVVFNSAIHPITAKVEYMKCFGLNYIYFGTGRYFYPTDEPGVSKQDRERLYGILIDSCLDGSPCKLNYAHGHRDVCPNLPQNKNSRKPLVGWYRKLDPKSDEYFKERLISDPTITDSNVIFFSTTEPTTELCNYGGRSRVWQLNCATGEDLFDQNCSGYEADITKGTLFLQLSQGNIEKITPGTGPTTSFDNSTTTDWNPGITPESPTPFISPSNQQKGKILLWIEK